MFVAVTTISGWVILAVFITNIYAAAANLKENSSDSELRNLGQILALSAIGVLLWECSIRATKVSSTTTLTYCLFNGSLCYGRVERFHRTVGKRRAGEYTTGG